MTQLAISIPQSFTDGSFDAAAMRTYLVRAEALGFHSAWTQESIIGLAPELDPVDLLTYAAACTERLRLGCAVMLTTLRSPVHLAKSMSTIDQMSGGRLEVGVGLGGRADVFPAFGVDPGTQVARFVEGLQVMKALWTEPSVTLEGRFWQLRGARMEPKPFQKPHPPVWFGANHPNALRRAVRLGDAFIGAGGTSTAQFLEQVQTVRQALEEAGRDPASFPIGKRVYIMVDDDRARAKQRAAEWFQRRYGRSGMEDQVAVWGTPDECVEGLRQVTGAGIELLLLTALGHHAEQLERYAAEIRPNL